MPDGSSNPFAYTGAATLASLLAQLKADPGLSMKQRQDLGSALRCIGRWLGLPLEAIPANLGFLRRKLEKLNPTGLGVSPRRLENVRSGAEGFPACRAGRGQGLLFERADARVADPPRPAEDSL
jgi:hypothetical protein